MKQSSSASSKKTMGHSLCYVAVCILFLTTIVFAYKAAKTRGSWQMHSVETLQSMDEQHTKKSAEDAQMMAVAMGHYPSGSPLYKSPKELQKFVTEMSKETGRDLVVVDTNKMIWADTVLANVGKKFAEDKNGEVTKTIADGNNRSFTEMSTDYPNGVTQTVVPLKDESGKTVGAVIFSMSGVFK